MKKLTKLTLASTLLVLTAAPVAVWRVLDSTEDERAIHRALAEGSSGVIIEFAYDPRKEASWRDGNVRVLAKKELEASDWQRLVAAFEPPMAFSARPRKACIFEPHHVVEWNAADGSQRRLFICFRCGQYYLPQDVSADFWNANQLRAFVESINMPLRSEGEYHTP